MKLSTVLRRRRSAGYVVVLLALAGLGVGYATLSPTPTRARAASPQDTAQLQEGKALFNRSCASCHGLHGQGTDKAPSIIGVGAAGADFQMSTGRMPLANPEAANAQVKTPRFSDKQIHAIAAYVASFAPGPAIPSKEDVAYKNADLALGGKLYRANCAQCHNFAGSGGALSLGREAPKLTDATPTQIYEAMQTGPAQMPPFPDATFSPDQKRAITRYVRHTATEPDPGGFNLGRVGPVTEGIVAWLVGMGMIVAAAMWITARHHD
ncbi:MAG: cytochrome bc1 complex diheme cytochrome c subunit [Streptosporangiaceae bacterium]